MLTLTFTCHWPIHQLDVHNAFLNGALEEEVFMQQLPGFEHSNKTLVCILNKALYRLKQSPKSWFKRLASVLHRFGFLSSKCGSSLFIHVTKHHTIFILVYVDNILIHGICSQAISSLITTLNNECSLWDLGQVNYFLRVEVKKITDGWLHLSQMKYIKDLLDQSWHFIFTKYANLCITLLKSIGNVLTES